MGMLNEDNGNTSSTRVVMILWAIVPLIVWAYLSLHDGKIIELPESIIAVILSLTAAKVIQKKFEA